MGALSQCKRQMCGVKSEARPAQPGKSIQWIDLSAERREFRRAAGQDAPGFA